MYIDIARRTKNWKLHPNKTYQAGLKFRKIQPNLNSETKKKLHTKLHQNRETPPI